MGLFDKLRNEFIDIIEWVDDTTDTIVWKFPRYQNEIKMNAQLTVRESQMAVFLNEGTVADVFGPGRYTLTTQNLPLLTTIKGWKYGFNSPFKADVFFVSMRQFTNQKWGTKNPVMLRDAEFGPVRLRAFGNYSFKMKDPGVFLKEISATNPAFTVEDINEQLRNLAVSRGMEAIAESKIPVLDLASNYEEVSTIITGKIQPEFNQLGLDLTKFLIENISLPEEVEAALDKRSSIGIVGNLGAYAQYQAATSLEKSAENNNGGGLMNAGIGAGLGAAMAGQVGNIFQQNTNNTPTSATPPPIPTAANYFVAVNGQQTGPFLLNDIITQIQSNTITPNTLIWKQGLASWIAANTIDELKNHFNLTPPPIPN